VRENHYDLIVLGTGPSGGTVASKAAKQNRRVALVDSRRFGGTCALRGCNPKKVYVNAAALLDQVRRSHGKLLDRVDVGVDWTQLHRFKESFTRPVAERSEASFQEQGMATFHGAAKFVDVDRIDIDGTEISAERILIATGAKPIDLKIDGQDLLTHSDEFLNLRTLPRRVLFLGGGYVSMEFAHVVARCGVATTVVEKNPRVLSNFDPDLVDQLAEYSIGRGVDIKTNLDVTAIRRAGDGSLRVSCGDETFDADLVVHGAGRVPDIDDLDLRSGRIDFTDGGVTVDRHLRSTTNDRVFATGDCADSGSPRLTPVANEEARIVTKNLFSDTPDAVPDADVVPKVAFTTPSIASVGLNEAAAREAVDDLVVRADETSSWSNVRKTGDTVAGYKILIDKPTDRIVGAHLLGPAAEETINLFALAMKHGLTATDVKSTLFVFPTFASDTRQML